MVCTLKEECKYRYGLLCNKPDDGLLLCPYTKETNMILRCHMGDDNCKHRRVDGVCIKPDTVEVQCEHYELVKSAAIHAQHIDESSSNKCKYWDTKASSCNCVDMHECPNTACALGHNKGIKFDKSKARWDLLPMRLIDEVVDVLTFGAKKYGPDNWRLVDNAQGRYYSALIRHIRAFREGERVDFESGKSHLAHAICNMLFMFETIEDAKEESKYTCAKYTCANCKRAIRGYPEEGDSWWCSIQHRNFDHPHWCELHSMRGKDDAVLVQQSCHNCKHHIPIDTQSDMVHCIVRDKAQQRDHWCDKYASI